VLGGTQSLHTNAFDEALALPSERSAMTALRTQQVIGYETGVTDTADPLGGSYFVEAMTDAIEERALAYIERIDAQGGAVKAVESEWMKREIEEAAYKIAREMEEGDRVVVGVTKFTGGPVEPVELREEDPDLQRRQAERLRDVKRGRDEGPVESALRALEDAARGTDNLLYPMREALSAYATLGEVSDALRAAFGEHEPAGF
jgi:methylmalonyl-CoA mutase N-terminal domain/subunit